MTLRIIIVFLYTLCVSQQAQAECFILLENWTQTELKVRIFDSLDKNDLIHGEVKTISGKTISGNGRLRIFFQFSHCVMDIHLHIWQDDDGWYSVKLNPGLGPDPDEPHFTGSSRAPPTVPATPTGKDPNEQPLHLFPRL